MDGRFRRKYLVFPWVEKRQRANPASYKRGRGSVTVDSQETDISEEGELRIITLIFSAVPHA